MKLHTILVLCTMCLPERIDNRDGHAVIYFTLSNQMFLSVLNFCIYRSHGSVGFSWLIRVTTVTRHTEANADCVPLITAYVVTR